MPKPQLPVKPAAPGPELATFEVTQKHVQEAMSYVCEALFDIDTWEDSLRVMVNRPAMEPLRDTFQAQRKHLLEIHAKLLSYARDHKFEVRQPACPASVYAHGCRGMARMFANAQEVGKVVSYMLGKDVTFDGKRKMLLAEAAQSLHFIMTHVQQQCPETNVEPHTKRMHEDAQKVLGHA